MREALAQQINERLCAIEESLRTLVKQHAHTAKLVKEIKRMATITQANIDALTQKVDDINTAVVAQAVELVKIGDDLTALATADLSLEALQAKVLELGGRVTDAGTKLQSVDDLIPERT